MGDDTKTFTIKVDGEKSDDVDKLINSGATLTGGADPISIIDTEIVETTEDDPVSESIRETDNPDDDLDIIIDKSVQDINETDLKNLKLFALQNNIKAVKKLKEIENVEEDEQNVEKFKF